MTAISRDTAFKRLMIKLGGKNFKSRPDLADQPKRPIYIYIYTHCRRF